jgi:hypothetical protein
VNGQHVVNWPKLVGIMLAMILLSVVFVTGALSESGYLGLMGLLVGYLVGNGVALRAGDPVEPVVGRQNRDSPAP